jgi:hypothetical protein
MRKLDKYSFQKGIEMGMYLTFLFIEPKRMKKLEDGLQQIVKMAKEGKLQKA